MNLIKVTIIVATYNSEKMIRNALESILQQSFVEWECIIVDGASKDGTIQIVKEYSIKDNRFRYISECDKGIYDAFNKGWKLARGEWIYYLGSDDILLSNGIFMLLEQCENYDVVYGNIYARKSGRIKDIIVKAKNCNVMPYQFCASHQGLIMKRSVIERLYGFDTQFFIVADKDLLIRAYNHGCKFKQTNVAVCIFTEGGVSSQLLRSFRETIKIGQKNNLGYGYLCATIYIYIKRSMKKSISFLWYKSIKYI